MACNPAASRYPATFASPVEPATFADFCLFALFSKTPFYPQKSLFLRACFVTNDLFSAV